MSLSCRTPPWSRIKTRQRDTFWRRRKEIRSGNSCNYIMDLCNIRTCLLINITVWWHLVLRILVDTYCLSEEHSTLISLLPQRQKQRVPPKRKYVPMYQTTWSHIPKGSSLIWLWRLQIDIISVECWRNEYKSDHPHPQYTSCKSVNQGCSLRSLIKTALYVGCSIRSVNQVSSFVFQTLAGITENWRSPPPPKRKKYTGLSFEKLGNQPCGQLWPIHPTAKQWSRYILSPCLRCPGAVSCCTYKVVLPNIHSSFFKLFIRALWRS